MYVKNIITHNDKNLDTIKNNFEILNRDIVNILDLEKINQTKQLYNHSTVLNISKAIKKTVESFSYNTNKKKITLTLVSEGALYIKINPSAFNRIVNNLLDNAVKYTAVGTGEINVSLTSDSSSIFLTIKDNGKGISKKELKKIFRPYFRSKRETNNQGLGISLFLVKSIIDSLNGRIEVESELDKGTTFVVVFPKHNLNENDDVIDFTPDEIIKRTKIIFSEETYDTNKDTLLIAENNLQLLSYLQESLVSDYNVFYATNGQTAFNKLNKNPEPDLIILDIMIEEMDGHEFYSKISKDTRYNDIPFIFMTTGTGKKEKLESLKDVVIDYITKPFYIEELKAKIKAILGNRNLTKEIETNKI